MYLEAAAKHWFENTMNMRALRHAILGLVISAHAFSGKSQPRKLKSKRAEDCVQQEKHALSQFSNQSCAHRDMPSCWQFGPQRIPGLSIHTQGLEFQHASEGYNAADATHAVSNAQLADVD